MQDRFARLGAELEGELVERAGEVRCALLALVAGCTFFQVGPPGVAKSLLARRLVARLFDVEFFDVQLDKFSTPEALYGPHDLKALKAGRWERVTAGTLVTADFAHIDEIFEASSALLKSMLWALNERIYRQGTSVIDMRLSTVFTSSNSVPTEPRLAALWDRLVLRRVVEPVKGAKSFAAMLGASLPDKPEPVLSWPEVRQAQAEAEAVKLGDQVVKVAFEVRRELAKKKVHPSDRRFVEAMAVVRAEAWLDGRSEAHPADLSVLADIMWQFPDQANEVRQVIARVLDSHVDPSTKLLHDVRAIGVQIRENLPDHERLLLAEELGGKVRSARRELDILQRTGRTYGTERVRSLLETTADDILEKLFDGQAELLDLPRHRR